MVHAHILAVGKFDTFHAASKNHFRQIFESYGSPVIVLDLLKVRGLKDIKDSFKSSFRFVLPIAWVRSQCLDQLFFACCVTVCQMPMCSKTGSLKYLRDSGHFLLHFFLMEDSLRIGILGAQQATF